MEKGKHVTQPSDASSFLFGAKGIGLSFKDAPIGAGYRGLTLKSFVVVQKRNFDTNEPEFWKDGRPVEQLRLVFDSAYRDPTVVDDDGTRQFFVSGGPQQKALANSIRAAGGTDIEIGAAMSITFVGEGEAKVNASGRKGYPPKIYEFGYQRPANAWAMQAEQPAAAVQPAWQAPAPQAAPAPVQSVPAWQAPPQAPVQPAGPGSHPGQWQPSPAAAQVAQQYAQPANPAPAWQPSAADTQAIQPAPAPAWQQPAPNMGPSNLPPQTRVPQGVHPAQHFQQVAQQPATLANAAVQAAAPPVVDQQAVQAAVAGMPPITQDQFNAMTPEQQAALQNLMGAGMVAPGGTVPF